VLKTERYTFIIKNSSVKSA